MPAFLEKKLKKQYGAANKGAIFGTMNKIGAMKGNKETAKGRAMEKKHARDAGKGKNVHDAKGHMKMAKGGGFPPPKKGKKHKKA